MANQFPTAAREHFASRLGFILISAGCAIGLGNVWRFPYIVGEYGGAAFILLYLIFLVILGLPLWLWSFPLVVQVSVVVLRRLTFCNHRVVGIGSLGGATLDA